MKDKPNIIVIGAGWAGLSCAYKLHTLGYVCTVLESAPQPGGRAKTILFDELEVDNGQHIAIGAYTKLLGLLSELGLDIEQLFLATNFDLHNHPLKLRLHNIPVPFNLIFGLLFSQGLSLKDEYLAHKMYGFISNPNLLTNDISVSQLLTRSQQPTNLIKYLWEPIALAALTTPIKQASAKVFLNVLNKCLQNSGNCRWLLPKIDLSKILVNPIQKILNDNILCNHPVRRIEIDDKYTIHCRNSIHTADYIVLALPPWKIANIISEHTSLRNETKRLKSFGWQPITTIYYRFSSPCNLYYPMLGMTNGYGQWLFDKRFCNQENIASVVISGHGNHNALDKAELANTVHQQIKPYISNQCELISYKVITEKQAAYSCDVGIDCNRVNYVTQQPGLFIAGDHTEQGLPSTLESSISSGINCAKAIVEYDS